MTTNLQLAISEIKNIKAYLGQRGVSAFEIVSGPLGEYLNLYSKVPGGDLSSVCNAMRTAGGKEIYSPDSGYGANLVVRYELFPVKVIDNINDAIAQLNDCDKDSVKIEDLLKRIKNIPILRELAKSQNIKLKGKQNRPDIEKCIVEHYNQPSKV